MDEIIIVIINFSDGFNFVEICFSEPEADTFVEQYVQLYEEFEDIDHFITGAEMLCVDPVESLDEYILPGGEGVLVGVN